MSGRTPLELAAGVCGLRDLRKENTDALAEQCVENFIEMRDRVSSPLFVLRKRLAVLLHWLMPGWYLPLYTMIEFMRIPYAEGRAPGAVAGSRGRGRDWAGGIAGRWIIALGGRGR